MGEEELAPTPPGRPRRERSLALSQGSEAVWAEPGVGPGHGSPQKAVKCLRVWGAEEPRRAESGAATVQKAPFFSKLANLRGGCVGTREAVPLSVRTCAHVLGHVCVTSTRMGEGCPVCSSVDSPQELSALGNRL